MKVGLIGPSDRSIWSFRRGLIKALINKRQEVYVMCPNGEYVSKIKSLGVAYIQTPMFRFLNPIEDLKYFICLYKIFRKERFDLIHTFTIKPNLYGLIAAKLAGIRRVYGLVEGLGFGYPEGPGLKKWLIRQNFLIIYRIIGKFITKMWFINQDDLSLFLKKRIINFKKAVFIRSIGVNLKEYSPMAISTGDRIKTEKELGIQEDRDNILIVMMIARLIWNKGIKEYIDAAKKLYHKHSTRIKLYLVGEIQPKSPNSVPKEYILNEAPPNFVWLGFRSDIPTLLSISDVVVLPSYYREGVPRCLLEAMAMSRPIIATDFPGCREVIKDGFNGYLIPIRDSKAIASSIEKFLLDRNLAIRMGKAGRDWVEREFDERYIAYRVIKELYGIS